MPAVAVDASESAGDIAPPRSSPSRDWYLIADERTPGLTLLRDDEVPARAVEVEAIVNRLSSRSERCRRCATLGDF